MSYLGMHDDYWKGILCLLVVLMCVVRGLRWRKSASAGAKGAAAL
jgi:hypothetical protein